MRKCFRRGSMGFLLFCFSLEAYGMELAQGETNLFPQEVKKKVLITSRESLEKDPDEDDSIWEETYDDDRKSFLSKPHHFPSLKNICLDACLRFSDSFSSSNREEEGDKSTSEPAQKKIQDSLPYFSFRPTAYSCFLIRRDWYKFGTFWLP